MNFYAFLIGLVATLAPGVPLSQIVLEDFKEVHTPDEFLSYYNRACTAICRTLVLIVAFALGSIVPIAMIVIGSIYLHDCPIEPYIPVYLIVGGVFGVIKAILSTVNRIRIRRMIFRGDPTPSLSEFDPIYMADAIVSLFLLIWFIIGTFWVFGNAFPDTQNKLSPRFCHPTLYWFSFILLVVAYILMVTTIIFVFCCCGVFMVLGLMAGRRDAREPQGGLAPRAMQEI